MNQRIITGYSLSLFVAVLIAACGETAQGQPANPNPGGSGRGSAETGQPGRPVNTPPAPAHPSPARCPDGAQVTVDPAHLPAPICLSVGHTVHLSTTASPLQPWQTFASSDPDVVRCESTRTRDGAVQAKCTGQKPGTAVLTTGTTPFQGDPHGPAQRMWQLTITVTP
jgi:hypothetical protein